MKTETVSRRGFLNQLIGIAGIGFVASALYPVIRFLVPPKSGEANVSQVKLPFGRAEIEAELQKYKTFRFGRQLGIILLTPDGKLDALSATCTHLECTVQYRPDLGLLWCACHNGKYDLRGKNISGPPPRPLELYVVTEQGKDILVSKGSNS